MYGSCHKEIAELIMLQESAKINVYEVSVHVCMCAYVCIMCVQEHVCMSTCEHRVCVCMCVCVCVLLNKNSSVDRLLVQWDPLIRKSSGPDFRFSYKRALF